MPTKNASRVRPNGTRIDQILTGMGEDFLQEPPKEGIIESPAPSADGDPCFVQVHVGDTVDVIGPCPYPLRGGNLPKAGDRCMLVTSELGQPWIVGFWPHA
jgi:hypothetical protein